MTIPSFSARLRSSFKSLLSRHRPARPPHHHSLISPPLAADHTTAPFSHLSPFAVPLSLAAAFAAAVALESASESSFCDAGDRRGPAEFVVKGSHKKVPAELVDELTAICGDNLTMDFEERSFHGKPQSSFHKAVNIPDIVVFPRSEEEVSLIVKSCNKHKIPIVPYGGATSIEGHTLAPHGGVCIDMSQMKGIKALHIEDMDVVVEPGIGWMELNEYLEPFGLFFPLDPGPGATIGGMCATRCSGSLAVRLS